VEAFLLDPSIDNSICLISSVRILALNSAKAYLMATEQIRTNLRDLLQMCNFLACVADVHMLPSIQVAFNMKV